MGVMSERRKFLAQALGIVAAVPFAVRLVKGVSPNTEGRYFSADAVAIAKLRECGYLKPDERPTAENKDDQYPWHIHTLYYHHEQKARFPGQTYPFDYMMVRVEEPETPNRVLDPSDYKCDWTIDRTHCTAIVERTPGQILRVRLARSGGYEEYGEGGYYEEYPVPAGEPRKGWPYQIVIPRQSAGFAPQPLDAGDLVLSVEYLDKTRVAARLLTEWVYFHGKYNIVFRDPRTGEARFQEVN